VLEYTYHLTQEDSAEIDNALKSFKGLDHSGLCFKSLLTFVSAHGIDGDLVDSTNFPFPNLRHTLRQLSLELYNGRGFCVIKGLDYGKYSVEDNTVIFLGIQNFIAETRARQDEKGNMIGLYKLPLLQNGADRYCSPYCYRRYSGTGPAEGIPHKTF